MALYHSLQVRLAKKCRTEGSVEVDNKLSKSDGSDSDRESLGELVAINSSIPGGAEAWRRCMPPCLLSVKKNKIPDQLVFSWDTCK